MKLRWEPITLELKTTFRVAHGASDQRYNVLVYLDDGVGEAPAVPYYGETQAGIIEYLQSVPDLGDDPFDLDTVLAKRPPVHARRGPRLMKPCMTCGAGNWDSLCINCSD